MGDLGYLIMASEYVKKDGKYIPIGGKADIVDGKKIKARCWYIVENASWVEVDFSDNIFSRVLSTKGGVKKVKTDNGKILYVASDDKGNHAHGDSIKQALDELAFKVGSRDVEQFRNMPKDTKKTPSEWALVYRMVTGACQSGTKMFVESKGKLKAKYTLAEIIEQTKGAYGHDKFIAVVGD
jgi:superfamily I DNA and/or RNA helicase